MTLIKKYNVTVDDLPSIPEDRAKKLKNLKDEEIDYSDLDDFVKDEHAWAKGELIKKPKTHSVSLRIEDDVLEFYKRAGKGWQTYINDVLRTYKIYHAKDNKKTNQSLKKKKVN